MTNLSKAIAIQFREVHLNGKWIATNYKAELSTISWQIATTKISNLNTIAALTYHINYYLEGVLNVFEGGTLDIRDKYSFNLPVIDSQESWEALQTQFYKNSESLVEHIRAINDTKLLEGFADGKYGSNYKNITGMIEHAYYHLGQIVILKKLIASN